MSLNDEPVKVAVCLNDLLFLSRINQAARSVHAEVLSVSASDEASLQEVASKQLSCIIVDLENTRTDTIQLISKLKAYGPTSKIPVVGYLSHVNTERQELAKIAGCDHVMPRSVFTQKLLQILSGTIDLS